MFLYKSPELSTGFDPWSAASEFTCQLFKVTGNFDVSEEAVNNRSAHLSELSCINPYLEVEIWNKREGILQFDNDNNLYFKARYANTDQRAVFKYIKATGESTEIINPQTNVDQFQVYGNGSVIFRYWQDFGSGIRLLR